MSYLLYHFGFKIIFPFFFPLFETSKKKVSSSPHSFSPDTDLGRLLPMLAAAFYRCLPPRPSRNFDFTKELRMREDEGFSCLTIIAGRCGCDATRRSRPARGDVKALRGLTRFHFNPSTRECGACRGVRGSLEGSRAGAEVRANDSAGKYEGRSRPRDEHSSMSRPPAATLIIFSRRVAPNLIACPERNSSEPLCSSCSPACCSQRKVVNSRLFRHSFQISARSKATRRRPPTTRLVLCLGKEGSQHPPFALFQNN